MGAVISILPFPVPVASRTVPKLPTGEAAISPPSGSVVITPLQFPERRPIKNKLIFQQKHSLLEVVCGI